MHHTLAASHSLIRRFALLALVLVGTACATNTWAKDICTTDGSNAFVFKSVKNLRPGGVIPLLGTFRAANRTVNFDGSAAMRPDGSIIAGIFVHSLADNTNNFTLEWTTDATLAGTAKFDGNGDHQSDGTLELRSVDCKSLSIP